MKRTDVHLWPNNWQQLSYFSSDNLWSVLQILHCKGLLGIMSSWWDWLLQLYPFSYIYFIICHKKCSTEHHYESQQSVEEKAQGVLFAVLFESKEIWRDGIIMPQVCMMVKVSLTTGKATLADQGQTNTSILASNKRSRKNQPKWSWATQIKQDTSQKSKQPWKQETGGRPLSKADLKRILLRAIWQMIFRWWIQRRVNVFNRSVRILSRGKTLTPKINCSYNSNI